MTRKDWRKEYSWMRSYPDRGWQFARADHWLYASLRYALLWRPLQRPWRQRAETAVLL